MNGINTMPAVPMGIQSTAGAVPIRNEKGEVSMQKVKVQRYISGKRPEYAPAASSEEESDNEDFLEQRVDRRQQYIQQVVISNDFPKEETEREIDDPRLRRLRVTKEAVPPEAVPPEEKIEKTESPQLITVEGSESESEEELEPERPDSTSESESDLDEDEIERRRKALRDKLAARDAEAETLGRADEDDVLGGKAHSGSSEEEEDDDEYTDSEEETGPRVKPVFVRASERMTVQEKEKLAKQTKKEETDAKKERDERRREALRLVENIVRSEQAALSKNNQTVGNLNDVCTDDENDEVEYESWKLREMKRIKRDKDEREALEKEALEIERIRNMTEEDRRLDQRINPKTVTNKAMKGKYKFLQKYYHRGAFYLDREEEVLKQDFSGPTLDDHFDKSVLPKVMQVKKFGRSGRTKYTHLVDQDTTAFDSPWSAETPRFTASRSNTTKQLFAKPTTKRKH